MIVDSSAIIALAFEEPAAARIRQACDRAPGVAIGSPTLVETGIVMWARLPSSGLDILSAILSDLSADVLEFGGEHWSVALDAWSRFGRGRHPARLNFGDCLTYATARLAGEPLLCTGNDFVRTDLEIA